MDADHSAIRPIGEGFRERAGSDSVGTICTAGIVLEHSDDVEGAGRGRIGGCSHADRVVGHLTALVTEGQTMGAELHDNGCRDPGRAHLIARDPPGASVGPARKTDFIPHRPGPELRPDYEQGRYYLKHVQGLECLHGNAAG